MNARIISPGSIVIEGNNPAEEHILSQLHKMKVHNIFVLDQTTLFFSSSLILSKEFIALIMAKLLNSTRIDKRLLKQFQVMDSI